VNAVPALCDPTATPVALFDASHRQPNWAQTGFTSRELDTKCAGLTEQLCRLGFRCQATLRKTLANYLLGSRLLVVPPPTGRYNAKKEQRRPLPTSLFSAGEVRDVLAFLQEGGRVLAFGYRFGDSFTQTNLGELLAPLGCLLNDDAVIDLHDLRSVPPLQLHFDTQRDALPLPWTSAGVTLVRWRPMATFTILPRSNVWPLALSTGGRCISFNRNLRQISFESLPIAVAGEHGRGKFVLVGGPHAFENGMFGLLNTADNGFFLVNVLHWLLSDQDMPQTVLGYESDSAQLRTGLASEFTRIVPDGEGQRTVAYVERVLHRTGVLKALSRAKWMP